MILGKRIINTGVEAACTTDTTDIFGDSSGVALYSLDFDASTAPDASTDYSGTPTDVEFGVGSKINYGARFNGSSSRIDVSSTSTTPFDASQENFTISLWVNVSSFGDSDVFISKWGNTDANRAYWLGLQTSSGDISKIAIYERSGSTSYTFNGSTSLSTNTWHHIVYVRNATQILLYIDNSAEVFSATNSINQGGSENVVIGQYDSISASTLNGNIDQVRIFSKALSSNEVSTLYAETACVYDCTTDTVNYPSGTTPVAYYKLDNSAEDETGSYDGTTTNVSYEFGRYGQAAHFSSGTFITSSFASLSQVTVSFWVKMTDVDTTRAFFVSRYGTNREFAIYTYDNSFNASLYYNGNNGNAIIITTSDYFNDNTWHHIAYTANGSTSPKLYIDGVERGTAQYSDATRCAYYTSSEPLSMGYSRTSSAYNSWDGRLDQVRIYSTALDSDQVTQLYEEKPCEDTSNFKAVLWKGNNTTGHFINNVGMDLETNGGLVWIKSRNDVDNHIWQDNVRGITNYIMSSSTLQQFNSDMVVSLEKTGFVLGADTPTGVNTNNIDFVAWCWKGGGDAVNIGVNSITASTPSIASDVSANTEAGFSIVKYTGNQTASQTIGHGLSSTPELIIVKNLDDSSYSWAVYNPTIGNDKKLLLNTTGAATSSGNWNNTTPTDSVFTISANGEVNALGDDFIAYCFHSVSEYSKIGTYEGDGTDDFSKEITGLGFDPSFVMVKNVDSSGSNWEIIDVRRGNGQNLYANENYSENANSPTSYGTGNLITDGFAVRRGTVSTSVHWNKSGDTFIYLAFA